MSENKRIYDLLIAAIRVSLGIDRQKVVISVQDATAFLHLARRHALIPLLAESISFDSQSVKEIKVFHDDTMLSVMRYDQFQSILNAVTSIFEEYKIVFIPLKGSVTNAFYPQAWMRTRSDIDILVKREKLQEAAALLVEKLGFQIESKNYHDITLRAKNGLCVELHFSLFEKMQNVDRVLENVWQFAKCKQLDSFEYVLEDSFFFFHQLAHTSYHFLNGGCGVRFLIDLWLLRQKLEIQSETFEMFCEQSGLKEFYKNVSKLCDCWFSDKKMDALMYRMESFLMDGSVFGTRENRVALQQNRQGGKLAFLFSRLFWSYDELKEMFPSLQGKRWLLPAYQFRRWLRIFNRKKFRQAMNEVSANNTLDQSEVDFLARLITDVGL